jgi:uncharacterized membrane protein YedE/YeeE
MARDVGSLSRTIIQFLMLFLVIYFVQYAVFPVFGPIFVPGIEVGGALSWVVSGIAGLFMWVFIKFLLYNVKRERTVL